MTKIEMMCPKCEATHYVSGNLERVAAQLAGYGAVEVPKARAALVKVAEGAALSSLDPFLPRCGPCTTATDKANPANRESIRLVAVEARIQPPSSAKRSSKP